MLQQQPVPGSPILCSCSKIISHLPSPSSCLLLHGPQHHDSHPLLPAGLWLQGRFCSRCCPTPLFYWSLSKSSMNPQGWGTLRSHQDWCCQRCQRTVLAGNTCRTRSQGKAANPVPKGTMCLQCVTWLAPAPRLLLHFPGPLTVSWGKPGATPKTPSLGDLPAMGKGFCNVPCTSTKQTEQEYHLFLHHLPSPCSKSFSCSTFHLPAPHPSPAAPSISCSNNQSQLLAHTSISPPKPTAKDSFARNISKK